MAEPPLLVPIPLETIRWAYHELRHSVNRDLLTQVGDSARLEEQKCECLNLLCLVQQVCPHLSICVYNGHPGRPCIEINPMWLATVLEISGGLTSLGEVFGCGPRTVWWHALELGLVKLGLPVYVDYVDPDGNVTHIYWSSTQASSNISDQELDEIMTSILQVFPLLGQRMIDGHLCYLGHYIPWPWIQASYAHVHGAPSTGFGPQRIQRPVYNIAGPNSLWHHDGQHGRYYIFHL